MAHRELLKDGSKRENIKGIFARVYKQTKSHEAHKLITMPFELLASSISTPIENSSWGISSTAVASTQERDIRKVAINSELHGI